MEIRVSMFYSADGHWLLDEQGLRLCTNPKFPGLAPGGRIVGTFLEGGRWHGFVAEINGDNLVVVDAKIRGKIAHDTGIVAIQGACTLGYFDVNPDVGQAGFVRCEGKQKHDIPKCLCRLS